ncbi:serine hydrolase domain-containing protein [Flagellimonas algicola]|uniref:Beta-lactamase family protein n=1 Tax=Flagellimonas algicola TaxID=2583815 RepID=A0ABY2WNP8_9FLAO|nr:serine hydrolase domain-containing protein [Allomuricauda algicola]TMU56610.1 beta-lactamase family protein [Allomuricauda algicola]
MRILTIKLFYGLLIVCIVGLTQCKPSPEKPSQDLNLMVSKLDSLGKSILEGGGVVGFSVAIMKGNDTLFNRGFGFTDTTRTQPVTNSTRFKIASISKLLGSTLVMKLVEEGKLSLDQNLIELLPDFPNPEQGKKITLEHLISHTSGLPEYATEIDSTYVRTGAIPNKQDFYTFFKANDLIFEPGSNYSYCNSGFLLMGMIVERISQRSLQQEFDRVINKSDSMDLRLIEEAATLPDMSPYWEKKGTRFIPYPHWPWIKGDGGLTATSIMLAQFPRQWSSGKFIDSASFQEMATPRILTDGIETGYGLGVRNGELFGERIIGHTGGHKSTYAIMVYFPERDMTFVVFTNTDNTPTSARKIFGEFAAVYLGDSISTDTIQTQTLNNPSNYSGSYLGYDSKIERTIQVKIDENGNLAYCMGDTCYPMTYLGNNKFWIEQWPYDLITFEVDDVGRAVALREYYTGFYVLVRKRSNPFPK